MVELLQSGRLIDFILVLVALEVLAFAVLPRFVRGMPGLSKLWPTLLSGVCLMVAVRLALTDAPALWIMGALLASLIAHVTDIASRVRDHQSGSFKRG